MLYTRLFHAKLYYEVAFNRISAVLSYLLVGGEII